MEQEEKKEQQRADFALPGGKAPEVVIIVNVFHKEPEDVLQEATGNGQFS